MGMRMMNKQMKGLLTNIKVLREITDFCTDNNLSPTIIELCKYDSMAYFLSRIRSKNIA